MLATAEVALGRNRFALGLLDKKNQPVTDGQVSLGFFKVNSQSNTGEKRLDARATFRAVELVDKGIWVAPATFEEPGAWGVQVTHQSPHAGERVGRLNFEVHVQFSAPGYDQPAPRSASPTLKDVDNDASRLCSNKPPCDLHALNVREALAPGTKPLVVLFATPALCTTATCAPELNAVLALRDRGYADRAAFVHVELYQHPFEQGKVAPAVLEWKLPSEPWVFVVDRSGIVRDRFEGAAPVEEIEPALKAVL